MGKTHAHNASPEFTKVKSNAMCMEQLAILYMFKTNSVVLIPIVSASLNKKNNKKKNLNSCSNPESGIFPTFQRLTSQVGCQSALLIL